MKNFRTMVVAAALCAGCTYAFAQAPLPQPQTERGIQFLNGGAGDEEITAIKAAMKDYSLALLFSRTGGEYVANVAVTIKDAKGATVFEAPSAGPWLLVKLPPGQYAVAASYRDQAKTQPVRVDRAAKTPVSFVWQ